MNIRLQKCKTCTKRQRRIVTSFIFWKNHIQKNIIF